MRVIVPFTAQYHPLARASHDAIPGIERVDVSARTDAYQWLLSDLWGYQETFLIIEHDVESTDRAIKQARHCACLWGSSPYIGPGGKDFVERGLGFVRFRKELMVAEPDLMGAVAGLDDGKDVPPGHWRRLDARIRGVLEGREYQAHIHSPVLQHHVFEGICACGTNHESYPVDVEGRFKP